MKRYFEPTNGKRNASYEALDMWRDPRKRFMVVCMTK